MKKLLTILFAFALGLNLSAQTVSPTYDPDVDGDNNIGINDLLALLSLFAENDEDDDGIWDSQDDCVGAYDECGVCNGPGPTISVIESITILYDSLYAEQIDEWWVYEVGADTVFNYFCVTQLDDTNIHEAVDLWLSDEAEALALYGPISAWDVSDVTNMTSLFEDASNFNGDISAWDVSGVTLMRRMFKGATNFNGDLSSWDVSNVTDMYWLFLYAANFNGDISSWDVSNVTVMTRVFKGATNFNADLSSWDVSSVTDMFEMFRFAYNFDGDISAWDMSSVTSTRAMFAFATSFNSDISAWDVSSVTDMIGMFSGATSFNSDISAWDVSNVSLMHNQFTGAASFNRDLSSWNVSNVTDMTEMFDDTPLSDENKCAIHLSFSANTNWPYEWADFCPFAIFNSCGDDIGYSGYDYATVQIGEQCWFAENLRTAQYANGDSIPGGLSTSEWQDGDNTNLGAQAIYNNDLSILADYGRLYNSYAVNDARGLCPSGWHVPTDGEWMTLEMELGMTETEANSLNFRGTDEGAFMKSLPSDDPSWNGTNTSGFSGLAGGQRDGWGGFYGGGYNGYFWTSSAEGVNAWMRALYGESTAVWRNGSHRRVGFSVRCVRD